MDNDENQPQTPAKATAEAEAGAGASAKPPPPVQQAPVADNRFQIVCNYKDNGTGNLNRIFDKYNASSLEAHVPIVNDNVVDQLQHISEQQRQYATLAFKTVSASMAAEGRPTRTRGCHMSTRQIDGQMFLARQFVEKEEMIDKNVLDRELDQYMSNRRSATSTSLASQAAGSGTPTPMAVETASQDGSIQDRPRNGRKTFAEAASFKDDFYENKEITEEDLDGDLEAYMARARSSRKRSTVQQSEQLQTLVTQQERLTAMEYMENYQMDD